MNEEKTLLPEQEEKSGHNEGKEPTLEQVDFYTLLMEQMGR